MSTVMSACWRKLLRVKATIVAAAAALTLLAGGAHAASRPSDEQAKVEIVVDKAKQTMTVYVDGQKRYEWRVSTGRAGYTTPSGTFRPSSMHRMAISVKYGNTPMPHSIFFTSVGHAIHATTAVRQLGHVASHGCIRLSPANAAALFALVEQMGLANTRIRIV